MASRDSDLASEYLAYAKAAMGRASANSRQWAFDEMNRFVREEPELAWPMIVEMVRRSTDDRILAFVAAGPLEDLIGLHGSTFIGRIETVARDDPRFRTALSGVWADVPADIEQRLARLIGDGPRL